MNQYASELSRTTTNSSREDAPIFEYRAQVDAAGAESVRVRRQTSLSGIHFSTAATTNIAGTPDSMNVSRHPIAGAR